MKTKQETFDTISMINKKIIFHHKNGNNLRKRYYQSLLTWLVSKEIELYG